MMIICPTPRTLSLFSSFLTIKPIWIRNSVCIDLMDTSPRSRAPPPSPAAREKPESSEDDDLDLFMKRSLRVPNLILPDRIVQREVVVRNPPEIDWESLISPLSEKSVARELRSSAAAIGCVQLVNHGIPRDLLQEATVAAGDAFKTTPDEKKKAARSPERRWGFEVEGNEEEESFWWDGSRLEEMAGIGKWSSNDFREKIEMLWLDMEKICNKIMEILKDNNNMHANENGEEKEVNGQVSHLCVHNKHCKVGEQNENKNYNNEKHEMMMLSVLMRSWGCSHGLALHVPSNGSTFQVYFKKGWLSFTPTKDALVLTLGDQLQKWSGGLYKHAIGKQVVFLQSDNNGTSSSSSIISMAFFYSFNASSSSPSSSITNSHKEKTISLSQQLMVATFLTLLFHLFVYLFV